MVATERIRRAETEAELKEERLEKEALRSALRLVEGENVMMRRSVSLEALGGSPRVPSASSSPSASPQIHHAPPSPASSSSSSPSSPHQLTFAHGGLRGSPSSSGPSSTSASPAGSPALPPAPASLTLLASALLSQQPPGRDDRGRDSEADGGDGAGQDIEYEEDDDDDLRAQPTPRRRSHIGLPDAAAGGQSYADAVSGGQGFADADDPWAGAKAPTVGVR